MSQTSAASRLLGVLALATILVGSIFGYVALQSLSGATSGTIAIWSGTTSNIPAGWLLCDGSNGTPDLRSRFIRGAPAGSEAGATGGSNNHIHTEQPAGTAHTHALQSAGAHQHTTSSAGAHTHSTTGGPGSGGTYSVYIPSAPTSGGAHTHTVNSAGAHTHTSGAASAEWGNHIHTFTGAEDTRPPYYEVLFIQATPSATVATGIIIVWTGSIADIPAGWDLCDGGSGRPDLRGRFISGAPNEQNAGATGGSETHYHTTTSAGAHTHATSDSQGAHSHTFNSDSTLHYHGSVKRAGGSNAYVQSDAGSQFTHQHTATSSTGAHTHTLASGGGHTHTTQTASSLPAHYDVVFIYNTAASSIPTGGILIWAGSIANIPSGFSICDGTSSLPNLRAKFIRGAAAGVNPGGTGGGDTHSHTDGVSGEHSHTQDPFSAAHKHADTNVAGAHTHGTVGVASTSGYVAGLDASAGDHFHTFNNDAWVHTHPVSSTGGHQHTINSADTRPAYYEVVFICATNNPPDAPTLSLPSANARFNPSTLVSFSWSFNDPNPGDTQSAYRLQLDDDINFASPVIDTGKVLWLSGWNYRKSHMINAALGAGNNYQVNLKTFYNSDVEKIVPYTLIVSTLPTPSDRSIVSAQTAVYWTGAYLHVWFGATTSGNLGDDIFYTKSQSPFTTWDTPVKVIGRTDGVRDPTILIEGSTIYLFIQCCPIEDIYYPIRLYKVGTTADFTLSGSYTYVGEVLNVGSTGSYDDAWVASPVTTKLGTTYLMVYEARDSAGKYSLGRATSTSIETLPWTKDGQLRNAGNIVLNPEGAAYPIVPDCFVDSDTLILHYETSPGAGQIINLCNVNGDFPNNNVALGPKTLNPNDGYYNHNNFAQVGTIGNQYYCFLNSWNIVPVYGPVCLRLYSTGPEVILNGKCRTDFGDVRFTDNDCTTPLDYWMESKVDGEYANFWVELSDSLDSSVTFYIYYGNSAATTTSNIKEASLWSQGDDFNDNSRDPNLWVGGSVLGGTATETNQHLELYCSSGGSEAWFVSVNAFSMSNFELQAFASRDGLGQVVMWLVPTKVTSSGLWGEANWYRLMIYELNSFYVQRKKEGGAMTLYSGTSVADTNTIMIRKANSTIEFYEGNSLRASETWNLASTICYIYLEAYSSGASGTALMDNFFSRKLVSPEPTHGSWNDEEATQSMTLPSAVGLYYWRAKTWDSKDAEGSYCTGRTIIVDRIKITACGILNNVVDTRTGGSIYYQAVYEYDNAPFTSTCGTLYLNEKAMNWTDKWTYAFPYEMSGSQAVFIITSVAETNYGLTAFNNVAGNIVLNWATMEINLSKP